MTTRNLAAAARAAGTIALAAAVAGLTLAAGTVFGLMLMGSGHIVPGAIIIVGYLAAYSLIRAGILDTARRSPRPAPYTAHPAPLNRLDATRPLPVVAPTGGRAYGSRNSFVTTSGVA